MPTAIEKIQAKAKALRKLYPNAKWTELIKKASTDLKKIGAIGSVSKKKKATKKAATKKTVSKRKPKVVKVLKQHGTSAKAYDKRHQALQAGRRISKSGRPYTETRSNRSDKGVLLGVHKDTKSHNVRISVMSGLDNFLRSKLNQALGEEAHYKSNIEFYKHQIKKNPSMKSYYNEKIKKDTLKIKKLRLIINKLKKAN